MFKKFSMENFTLYRNQTINLQCTLIDFFQPNLSLHHKGLLNSPECKNQILYSSMILRVYILHKLDSCQEKIYKYIYIYVYIYIYIYIYTKNIYIHNIYIYIYIYTKYIYTKYIYVDIYALSLFIEHSGEH